jgi:hypothetical protein
LVPGFYSFTEERVETPQRRVFSLALAIVGPSEVLVGEGVEEVARTHPDLYDMLVGMVKYCAAVWAVARQFTKACATIMQKLQALQGRRAGPHAEEEKRVGLTEEAGVREYRDISSLFPQGF